LVIIEKVLESCEASNKELIEKKKATLKTNLEMVETLKELLIAVGKDQKSIAKVVDNMEERLDQQMKVNKESQKKSAI
jgi:hypothetical protein